MSLKIQIISDKFSDRVDPLQLIKFVNNIDTNFKKLRTDLAEDQNKYFAASFITAILKEPTAFK